MLAIGCDHGGYTLKNEIIGYLNQNHIPFQDCGTYGEDATDYPVYAKKVTEAVLSGACDKGLLLCGTGIGISIAANRVSGIRAALCHDVFSAKACRLHNNANILAMGGRVIGSGSALEVLKAFLETEFSEEERHARRIRQIEDLSEIK